MIDTIRFKPLVWAYANLENLKKKGARLLLKTLRSAEANAKVKKMDANRLFVREVRADGGPVLKRYMSRSMGRADTILKRTTHLSVILSEREVPIKSVKQGDFQDKGKLAKPIKQSTKARKMAGAKV